ncbi:hypothetical protein TrVE_jg3650 [Triparma verrucosa]|uniref:30S ribosomal protein S21 n=2 Tax=Triparma TaxID=722752 RepID=A0A9W7F1U7_9STRA|nr:hypothetical protein TrVE_jg3650 [Triparma verrucosa]GMH97888.1 hypothetical protein TrST_g11265 [Triparma strigata]
MRVLILFILASLASSFMVLPKTSVPSPLSSVKISVSDGEPVESALRRFKREVNKSGHLMELRHRRHFENSQEYKKRKLVQARNRKRLERLNKRRMSNRT